MVISPSTKSHAPSGSGSGSQRIWSGGQAASATGAVRSSPLPMRALRPWQTDGRMR